MSRETGHGARDHDPISIMLLIFMGFVLLEWLATPGVFSPIPSQFAGAPCVTNSNAICYGLIADDFGAIVHITTPLLIIVVPLSLVMFAYYFMKVVGNRDPKDYFDTSIVHSRAMIKEADKAELEYLDVTERSAMSREEKNRAIAEYNRKVDEMNKAEAAKRKVVDEE